ncbi:DUF5984 family protein [Micromonospora maris]|nr:DUF5984 family protein [Micromonospora maris]
MLHWFGLTDGWYWIDLNGHELLRYSDHTMRHLHADGYEGMPYVDYYVVRLWEDLLQALPAVLEPVPADLVLFEPDRAARRASRPRHLVAAGTGPACGIRLDSHQSRSGIAGTSSRAWGRAECTLCSLPPVAC